MVHALISCPSNQGIGQAVLGCLPVETGVQDQHVLKLQLGREAHDELPVICFLAVAWSCIWECRRLGKRPTLYKVRAELEAKVSLLRESRHSQAAEGITSMIYKL